MTRTIVLFATAAALCCAALASTAHAIEVQFRLDHFHHFTDAQRNNYRSYALLNPFRTYTLRSPNELSGSNGFPTHVSFISPSYPSLSAAMAETSGSGPWRLNLTDEPQSTYDIAPNLSAFDEALEHPFTRLASPLPGGNTGPTPTFTWEAPTHPVRQIRVELERPGTFPEITSALLSGSARSWTPAVTLADGDYQLRLWLHTAPLPIPLSSTLVSGANQGSFTGSFEYTFQSLTPFHVVVPEPSAVGVTGIAVLLLSCRRPLRRSKT